MGGAGRLNPAPLSAAIRDASAALVAVTLEHAFQSQDRT